MLLIGGRMLKYFVIPLVFFSLCFPFIYDSHIGNDEKIEVNYMEHPALTGFTDTPKEGRLQAEYIWFPSSSISKAYNLNGEAEAFLSTQELNLSAFSMKLDYFGYKKSGVALYLGGIKSDYLNESLDDKVNEMRDSLKVVQRELISTMELLWKQNKKSVTDLKETFEDSLHAVKRSTAKVDQKVADVNSDLVNHIRKMEVAIDGLNKAITTINGNISGLKRSINDVSSKLDVLSTKVSKIKKK